MQCFMCIAVQSHRKIPKVQNFKFSSFLAIHSGVNAPPPPPKSYFFCLLVWDACHVVGTTCNERRSLRNTFGWMGALQSSQQLHGRVLVEVQGARSLKAPKNLHLTVPKSGSNIAQQYLDGYAMFYVHCSTKSQENPKGPKFQILKFLIRKKMCMFHSSSWILFLKVKKTSNLRVIIIYLSYLICN